MPARTASLKPAKMATKRCSQQDGIGVGFDFIVWQSLFNRNLFESWLVNWFVGFVRGWHLQGRLLKKWRGKES